METCYEEPTAEDVFTTEKVQTWSQSQQKGQYPQGNQPQYQKQQNNGQKSYPWNIWKLWFEFSTQFSL